MVNYLSDSLGSSLNSASEADYMQEEVRGLEETLRSLEGSVRLPLEFWKENEFEELAMLKAMGSNLDSS